MLLPILMSHSRIDNIKILITYLFRNKISPINKKLMYIFKGSSKRPDK
jgi:hypothetical protein